jgi:hypothetical protein
MPRISSVLYSLRPYEYYSNDFEIGSNYFGIQAVSGIVFNVEIKEKSCNVQEKH